MESKKRFERWNCFEITLNEQKSERTPPFDETRAQRCDKERGLEKMEKAASGKKSSVEGDPPERLAVEDATSERTPPREETAPSLWERARRAKAAADAKREKSAPWELSEKNASSNGSEFFPRRPRTHRMSEPPRRFDRLRRDWE